MHPWLGKPPPQAPSCCQSLYAIDYSGAPG
jgi:hypothetical protein